MKVLLCNKYFYLKGGSETYCFSLRELLQKNKVEVLDFSMKDSKNFPSDYSDYFIEPIDYNGKENLFSKLKSVCKLIYSNEARRKLIKLMDHTKPDIAHLHVFHHQLSPSIVYALKKRRIPIVYTAHDLKLLCANYKMIASGTVCEECKGGKHIKCLQNKCVKNSSLKSLVNVVEMYVHDWLKCYCRIDRIITPSKFYQKKFIEYGFDEQKIIYIPNFLDANDFQVSYTSNNYCIYLGRLSEEKGILTLFKAMEVVEGTQLYVIGTGPMEKELRAEITKRNLGDKVRLLGFKGGEELSDLIRNSMFSIIPSEWYENAPYSLLEMMAYGKPVIGADIGGIPELIEDNRTGLLYKSGDASQLAQKINYFINNREVLVQYGKNARAKLENEFNPTDHGRALLALYHSLT